MTHISTNRDEHVHPTNILLCCTSDRVSFLNAAAGSFGPFAMVQYFFRQDQKAGFLKVGDSKLPDH